MYLFDFLQGEHLTRGMLQSLDNTPCNQKKTKQNKKKQKKKKNKQTKKKQ